MKITYWLLVMFLPFVLNAQQNRWQQKVEYQMNIDLDVNTHQYRGEQKLTYHNNSPEQLNRVFYHLYFNAFQPGSMMDVRSRTIADPDGRVGSKIAQLDPEQQGWIRVESLSLNGKACKFETVGTILEVELPEPIKAGSKVKFEMKWTAQVPIQIRRSGRSNKEGVAYSMTQWYPKMCEYDYEGWHATPYVAREFHGVWGDFEVNISLDKRYTIGGTGVLKNAEDIGHGYQKNKTAVKEVASDRLTWKFVAENVHDFAWAADPDYLHDSKQVENGPVLHFIYQNDSTIVENWKQFQDNAVKAFSFMSEKFGKYPYPQYTIIQGGDGGMEYPMTTLITGKRSPGSLLGVTVHEAMHSWYQGVLATNESLYEWMDEGFTSYGTDITMSYLSNGDDNSSHTYAYDSYLSLAKTEDEMPLSTHADHYKTNRAYGVAAYSKGEVFLHQLGYIVGHEVLQRGLKNYFEVWKFKHPNPTDFKRVIEKESGLELDWYFEYFVNSKATIDYSIHNVFESDGHVTVDLERIGDIPMPIDLEVRYTDGSSEMYNIPLRIMRGTKAEEYPSGKRMVLVDWPWTHPYYSLTLHKGLSEIESIEIDPSQAMADIERKNNLFKRDDISGLKIQGN